MKVTEGMKRIEKGWVVKPLGFRVKFQQVKDGELINCYSPSLDDTPLDSDVTAWRYAWKLAMATKPAGDSVEEGDLVNITVIDDQNDPMVYYETGDVQIYNSHVQ